MNDTQNAAGTALEKTSGPGNENQQLTVFGDEMTIELLEARIKTEEQMRNVLKDHLKRNLKEGYHYSSKIGNQELAKPMLLQEGTRNICSLMRLFFGEPRIEEKWLDGDHYRVRTHIALFNARGNQITSGDGICSTRETKYAYRTGQRVCPECEQPTVRKDNKTENGGWYCWKKDGISNGCGAKFAKDDIRITEQQIGRIDNPDKADIENTVLKMAVKRAKSAAICDVPLVSELFAPEGDPPEPKAKAAEKAEPRHRGDVTKVKADHVANVCGLVKKLLERGVEFEDLAVQFLPEGVARFEDLTDDQALTIQPSVVELLNSKLK